METDDLVEKNNIKETPATIIMENEKEKEKEKEEEEKTIVINNDIGKSAMITTLVKRMEEENDKIITRQVRGVSFPVVSPEGLMNNAIEQNRNEDIDIAELSKNVKRDCLGRTFDDIRKSGETALKLMDTNTNSVLMVYLEKMSKVKADDIAKGQMMLVELGLKVKFECPTTSLGRSSIICSGNPHTNGTVWSDYVDYIRRYLLYKIRELYPDQPTDIVIEKNSSNWVFDWGYCYITVFVVNTTFVPNRYTPQFMESRLLLGAGKHILPTQILPPIHQQTNNNNNNNK